MTFSIDSSNAMFFWLDSVAFFFFSPGVKRSGNLTSMGLALKQGAGRHILPDMLHCEF